MFLLWVRAEDHFPFRCPALSGARKLYAKRALLVDVCSVLTSDSCFCSDRLPIVNAGTGVPTNDWHLCLHHTHAYHFSAFANHPFFIFLSHTPSLCDNKTTGNLCNGAETCNTATGLCVPATSSVTCTDNGLACDGAEVCNPSTGLCESENPSNCCTSDAACDDGE